MTSSSFCKALGVLPFGLPVSGRRRDLVFRAVDWPSRKVLRCDSIETEFGLIDVDVNHDPERLLAYMFHNVLRYYKRSALGRWLRETADPRMTFVDVGANLGMYSLVARGCGMRVVAVEPEPMHAAFLTRNAHVFGRVLPLAMSDKQGHLPLYYLQSNPGATSLFPAPGFVRSSGLVTVKTFSEAASEGQFGDPSCIGVVKIDVEGFEGEAVAGMCHFLDQGHRPSIWCEVRGDGSGRNGGSFRVVRELLLRYGYQVDRLDRRGSTLPVDERTLASEDVFDLLFTPYATTVGRGFERA